MTDHELRLSPAAVKDGVWIDDGEWVPVNYGRRSTARKAERLGHKVTEDPPVIMRRTERFTEAEARERGWLL